VSTDYRSSQADLMREKRDSARIVVIPPCADRERRELLESCDEEWLAYYFALESGSSAPFTYAFTEQQREMIAAIRVAIVEGGDQSIAASRGEGKSTYCERMLIKYTLQGVVDFSVLFAATGGAAENSLDSIKTELENNLRLHADYPEVCIPILALEDTPNRAHYQRVSGSRHDNGEAYEAASSKFSWCGQEVILPKVPGSPAAGAIIATRGLDSAIRGLKKKGKRPKVAVIDDPDTEETANSEEQAGKLEKRIDRTIGALGDQTRRCSRVMLTTLQNRICVSYRFTGPDKPSWKSKRFRFLVQPPLRIDLWTEYVALKKLDWANAKQDNPTSHAHELYVANRDAMEAGSAVSNPNRYTQGELSAMQFYYNEVARIGPEAVASEYDNDPPESLGPVESGISAAAIQRQVSGMLRGVIPDGATLLTIGADVGKWRLHWVVRAWMQDGTSHTIDYGTHQVYGQLHGSDEGLGRALQSAIMQLVKDLRDKDYCDQGGEVQSALIREAMILVDASYRTDDVYAACAESGLSVYPLMGFGDQNGGATKIKYNATKTEATKYLGDHCKIVQQKKQGVIVRLVECCSNYWKTWEHDRWMTALDKPGHFVLFGERADDPSRMSADQQMHGIYAQQICNEVEVEEPYKGGIRRKWIQKGDNHYLDASYYADVAASIRGVSLPGPAIRKVRGSVPVSATAPQRVPTAQRPSARDLAAKARGR
jgi:hypothetical protein